MEQYRYCQGYNKIDNRKNEISTVKNTITNIEIQKQKLNVLMNTCTHPQQKAELQAHIFTLEAEMQKLKHTLAASLLSFNSVKETLNNSWSSQNVVDSGVSTVSGTTTPGIIRESGVTPNNSNMLNNSVLQQNNLPYFSQNKDEDVLSHQGSVLSLDWSVFSENSIETPLNVLNDLNNIYNSFNFPSNNNNTGLYEHVLADNNLLQDTLKLKANHSDKTGKQTFTNNLQTVANQAVNLNQSINEISQYRSDTLVAVQALPELFRLLNDPNLSVIVNTTQILHQMSKKDATRQVIIANPQIVSKIIFLLSNAEMDSSLCLNTVGIIHNFSQHKDILLTLNNLKAPIYLLRLLKSNVEGVLNYTIAALHNFLLYCDQSRALVKQYKVVNLLIPLLKKDNVKFLAIVTDCLQLLAYDCQDTRWGILSNDGLNDIINLIKIHSYEKLLYSTCRLIKVLSVCQSCKTNLIELGAVNSLSGLLLHNSHRLLSNCLWALRNLSDSAASNPDGYEQLVQASIIYLANPDSQISVCAAGILMNLTCNNPTNKSIAIKYSSIEVILNTIPASLENYDLLDPLICTLKHLTCRNPESELARDKISSLNGFSLICNILLRSYPLGITKASLGLIRNLALSKKHLSSLNSLKIPTIMQTLALNAYNKMSSMSVTSNGLNFNDSDLDKVTIFKEIIEGSIGTILIFTTDFSLSDQLIESEFLSLLIKLTFLPINNDNLVRTSVSLFTKIIKIFDTVSLIDKLTPLLFKDNSKEYVYLIERLHQLSSSNSEEISTCASILLFKLSEIFNAVHSKAEVSNPNCSFDNEIFSLQQSDTTMCENMVPLFESNELSWEITDLGKSIMEIERYASDNFLNLPKKSDCEIFFKQNSS